MFVIHVHLWIHTHTHSQKAEQPKFKVSFPVSNRLPARIKQKKKKEEKKEKIHPLGILFNIRLFFRGAISGVLRGSNYKNSHRFVSQPEISFPPRENDVPLSLSVYIYIYMCVCIIHVCVHVSMNVRPRHKLNPRQFSSSPKKNWVVAGRRRHSSGTGRRLSLDTSKPRHGVEKRKPTKNHGFFASRKTKQTIFFGIRPLVFRSRLLLLPLVDN